MYAIEEIICEIRRELGMRQSFYIADRIALAGHPAELDEAVKTMWGHHFAGALTEAEIEVLDEAARARRAS
jgi:hypothetical protein